MNQTRLAAKLPMILWHTRTTRKPVRLLIPSRAVAILSALRCPGAGRHGFPAARGANIAESRREPGRWARHARWSGGYEEVWLAHSPVDHFDSDTALAQTAQVPGPGLTILRVATDGGDRHPNMIYGLAAFWVFGGGDGGAYTATGHDDYSRTPWVPQLDWDLGRPVEPVRRRGNGFHRELSHGWAAVNLNAGRRRVMTFDVPPGLLTETGAPAPATVILPPHRDRLPPRETHAMTWLVTGGAGYIGAHVVAALTAAGTPVVVLDDLSTGVRERLPADVPLVVGTIRDRHLVRRTLIEHSVTGVMHLAARKQVAESVAEPLLYYADNVDGLISVLEGCRAAGVSRFVFTSSAAVYGAPDVDLVTEGTPCAPVSPYGQTKLIGEWLVSACATWGLAATSLRYFNVAGAATPALGDRGAANLVPLVFQALSSGRRPAVFGTDLPTPDGTCVRDYVHVADIADAHLAAAAALDAGKPGGTYNIGRGQGASVRDVLTVIGEVTGLDVTPDELPRRPGDPARVVASADLAHTQLGFTATRDLYDTVASAWAGWDH